ncbi:MAG: transaldolase family protein [Planctomycetota bacterium]
MAAPLQSLVETGTKLYLDSVEPSEVDQNLAWGAVGATSNPAIISAIVKTGGLDAEIERLLGEGKENDAIAWALADHLVADAQSKFEAIHAASKGNTGWVSFELDPLLETAENVAKGGATRDEYIRLGTAWNEGHVNRMIKVPATVNGLAALESLAAAGVTLNVTLIFTEEQYVQAREAIWRGAQAADAAGIKPLTEFKSVYSIFISRIDVYTKSEVADLTEEAQGLVGIVNAKRIWKQNRDFWADKGCELEQELIFASTGTKDPSDPPWKYVQALAGSDIQTNPPETNEAVAESDLTFQRTVDVMPSQSILDEIDAKVDLVAMQHQLMEEGVAKFIKPQQALLDLIASKRAELSPAG